MSGKTRNFTENRTDIYAQRIDSDGNRLWEPNDGKLISGAAEDQSLPNLISDGSGGAIIIWQDYRNGDADLYAQHIDRDGDSLWTAGGKPVCTAAGIQAWVRFISDGNGGIIITWQDSEYGYDYNIYAQRIRIDLDVDLDGDILWDVRGVPIFAGERDQRTPHLTSDGNGGAIITWEDWYPGGYTDVYAQRIDEHGERQWGSSGVLLCNGPGVQRSPKIAPYNFNSFIIVWEDWRRFRNNDIYAQLVDLNGALLEDPGGIAICTSRGNQGKPEILPDGIIKWEDSVRNRTYVQKISYVSDDIDEDGLPNEVDPDDDGDGFRDGYDPSGDTTRASGVVACYEFNNARDVIPGTSIPDLGFDSSGNNNILTNVNGVESVSGWLANGVRLTAANESYLYIPTEGQNGLHITGDMTITAWINVIDFPQGVFVIAARQGAGDTEVDYTLFVANDGTNRLGSWDGTTAVFSDSSISLGSWHHVALVKDEDNITFYIDGEPAGTSFQEFPATDPDLSFYMGSNSGATVYANGLIDELAIYNRALTPEEISGFGT